MWGGQLCLCRADTFPVLWRIVAGDPSGRGPPPSALPRTLRRSRRQSGSPLVPETPTSPRGRGCAQTKSCGSRHGGHCHPTMVCFPFDTCFQTGSRAVWQG